MSISFISSPREVVVAVAVADCVYVIRVLSSFRSLRSVLSHNDAEPIEWPLAHSRSWYSIH